MKGLQGKNVLVTGASTGIGRAIALRFAQEGANVAINYYNSADEAAETLESVQKTCGSIRDCGVGDLVVQADVSKEEDVAKMFQTVIEAWDRLDILVNNAGIQKEAPSHELEANSFDKIIGINLRGAYLCSREALRHFLSRDGGGSILNVSSVHEIIPRPEYLSYSISKGGMGNLTRTLALEYANKGIRVNGIGPGATATPINDWAERPEEEQQVASHIPMGRVGEAEEMAAAAAFLSSDEAAYITGQTLYIDGGLTLYADFRENWSA